MKPAVCCKSCFELQSPFPLVIINTALLSQITSLCLCPSTGGLGKGHSLPDHLVGQGPYGPVGLLSGIEKKIQL